MTPAVVEYLLKIILYAGIQIFLLKNFALFNVAFCLVYVHFALRLHSEISPLQALLLSFLLGLLTDLFYDCLGLHAAALTALAFARQYWLRRSDSDGGFFPSVANNGFLWYVTYAFPLIVLHHFILFFAEVGLQLFWQTLLKVVASSFFTLAGVLVIEYLLPQRRQL